MARQQIPNIKNRILTAARKDLNEKGYIAFSMRQLAKDCGIAVGTVYNYFDCKEDLTAHIMMEDWLLCINSMKSFTEPEISLNSLPDCMSGLCCLLENFTKKYRHIWEQYNSTKKTVSYTAKYHAILRRQLAEPIRAVFNKSGYKNLLPLAPVLAETMLACALNADLGSEHFRRLTAALTP